MKPSLFILTFLISIIAIACGQTDHSSQKKESDVFSYYLKNAFGDSIPQQKKTWILIPEVGCKGCRQGELGILHDEVLKTNAEEIQYIFSSKVIFPDSLVKPASFWIDEKNLIDKINLPISNISIVKTEKGKIVLLKEISADRMDSIEFYLKD